MTTATDTEAIRAAFIADIIENPEDDATRLIFADWLQDHGEPHAARFIRGQIAGEVASLPWSWSAKVRHTLRGTSGNGHIESRPGVATWVWNDTIVTYRRGFVHTVHCPTATWLQHRVELVRSHPVQRVELTDKKPVLCNAMDGEDITGKYRWSRFVGGEEGEVNHYIGGRFIPRDTHMNEAVWSIHATEPLALDWLSERLITRAMELAKEAARGQ